MNNKEVHMKRIGKTLLAVLSAGMMTSTLASCGSSKPEITLWVGEESVAFYQKVCNEFEKEQDFGYSIRVVASDAGSIAGPFVADNTACGDIVTVAHDNIGKFAQKQLIRGINDPELLAQIEADNPDTYKEVIKSVYGKDTSTKYTFGVPYISQTLFLMYNKTYISEEQAKTFEGLKEAVDAANAANPALNASAVTSKGSDGFNFSFTLLARNAQTKETSLKLYENLVKTETYAQGDDTVANLKWINDATTNQNLFTFPNSSGFQTMLNTGSALSVIGGAWMYGACVKAMGGEDKVGIATIPTWTLQERHVEGTTIPAGTVMQGGSFADCKAFVINGAISSDKYQPIQKLLKHLSSKEVQNKSFLEAYNVPAYEGYMEYIETIKDQVPANIYNLAKAQDKMAEFGIPQPFVTSTLNNYYYMQGADGIYSTVVEDEKTTDRKIREALWNMEYIWKWGDNSKATVPEVLPGSTDKQS